MQYLEKHVINYYFSVMEEIMRKLERHKIGDFLVMNLYTAVQSKQYELKEQDRPRNYIQEPPSQIYAFYVLYTVGGM